MRPEDLSKALAPKTFRPFMISLSNGETYPITHPEQIMLDRSVAVIGTRRLDGARRYEKTVLCALMHVVSLVPIEESEAE